MGLLFIKEIIGIDIQLFHLINQCWTHTTLDTLLPFFRIPSFWIPLYVFLGIFMLQNTSHISEAVIWILIFGLIVSTCDIISSHLIKNMIYRLRPCQDPYWEGKIRLLVSYCSTRSSFTSSHATNHFGMGIFLFLSLKKYIGNYRFLFLLWAFTVSYAQVYVGLHYPLDITVGGLIGSTIGYFGAKYYAIRFP